MKIVVVGLGYVGLANAVLLAQHNEVIGVDVCQDRVNAINAHKSPIQDKELIRYLEEKPLNFTASCDLRDAVAGSTFVIVSTPTNYDESTNSFDTSSVENVISVVLQSNPNACIVVKSTVPVGFVDHMRDRFKTDSVIFSPEFLREGHALEDNLYPSRIIVGEKSKRAKVFAELLAEGAIKNDVRFLFTGTREAEAIKLFSNSYLAMRVAFFNELDSYALAGDMDTREIINGVSLDPRIGEHYNNPSFGYGGYCLPKDTKQLLANYHRTPQNLIGAIVQSNVTRKNFLTDEIEKKHPRVVGIYRLEMKADSDNFRESAIKGIMRRLLRKNIRVIIFEPRLKVTRFSGCSVISELDKFKRLSDVIVANRINADLHDVNDKIFTRDLFHEN